MLTLSFVAWLSTFPMSGSPFHVIMTVVGTMGMTWSVLEWNDFVHADDLFEDSEVVE
jgi:ABC-type sulfate transport system substrate-binding protein